MAEPIEHDSSSIGAYAVDNGTDHAGDLAIEINDGEMQCIVYLSPEEGLRLADDLVVESAQALYITESRKMKRTA